MTDSFDPYNKKHMGCFGELCASEKNYSREVQDEYAISSYKKAINAAKSGLFDREITPLEVKGKQTVLVTSDEEPDKVKFEKIPKLKPVFEKEGTITAANASKLNDGASALVLASEEKAKKFTPLAKIIAHCSFAGDPKWFTTAPIGAIKKVIKMAGLELKDIDLFEINEAFASQGLGLY